MKDRPVRLTEKFFENKHVVSMYREYVRVHASVRGIYHKIMYPFVKINASINLDDGNFRVPKKKGKKS